MYVKTNKFSSDEYFSFLFYSMRIFKKGLLSGDLYFVTYLLTQITVSQKRMKIPGANAKGMA